MRFALALFLLCGAAAPALADALDRISETGTIRFGVRESSAPFSYLDESGAPTGLAVLLCGRVAIALAKRLGREALDVEYVTVDAKTRFDAIDDGRVDIHCGPMTATLTRRERLDFSIPYFMDGIGAALRRDGVQDLAALSGEPVGALAGTTAAPAAGGRPRAFGDISKPGDFRRYRGFARRVRALRVRGVSLCAGGAAGIAAY